MYDLTGKSVQRLELAIGNKGYNSPVKVLMAKQNDINSRFIHAIIHDATSKLEFDGCIVQLNSILPDGTPIVSCGEIQGGDPYVKLPRDVLSQEGRVSCEISLTGSYKEVSASISTSVGLTQALVEYDTFAEKISKGGKYTFTYTTNEWHLEDEVVSLAEYGITYDGEPIDGDVIVVDFNNSYTLTTETFYVLVQESNYKAEAEVADNSGTLLEYIKAQMGDMAGEIQIIRESAGVDLHLDRTTNKIYLLNSEDQTIGDGIALPETVNGFVTETDENGNNYLYLAYNGEIVGDGVELPSGGGGGGGGSSYVVRVINNLGTTIINAAAGQPCKLNFTVAEYYGQEQTNTNVVIAYLIRKPNTDTYVNVGTDNVAQGTVIKDVSKFLSTGDSSLRVVVTGGESGITKTTTYTISVADIYMTSTFNAGRAYNNNFNFAYKCFGRGMNKMVHFEVDGEEYCEPIDIGTSHNVQLSQTLDFSKYGHGAHTLEVYFTTDTGAKSPSLIYEVAYYMSGNTETIITSDFNVGDVTYGNSLTLDYYTYTYGGDYTPSLTRRIYTLEYQVCDASEEGALLVIEAGQALGENQIYLKDVGRNDVSVGDYVVLTKVIFDENNLVNIVNMQKQTWVVQNYPEKGNIYLELQAGNTYKTFKVYVNEIETEYELEATTTGLVAALSTSGRSNNDISKSTWRTFYTTIDNRTTTISAELENFDYSSNGWVTDEDGASVLRHSGTANTTLQLPIFASNYTDEDGQYIRFSGTPSNSGRTIEIEFNVHDVTDYEAEIMRCFDDERGTGFVITPRYAYLLANTMAVEYGEGGIITNEANIPVVTFKDGEKVRISFVIENVGYFVDGAENKQLVRIYINGELSKALNYGDAAQFANNAYLTIGHSSCITDIYSIRMYDIPLEDSQVLRNYIADLGNVNEKLERHEFNNVLNDRGEIDYNLCRKKYPCMLITGQLSQYKGDKTNIGIIYTKPDATAEGGYTTELDCMDTLDGEYVCQSNVQGTSSQRYAKKNYKFTFKKVVDGEAEKIPYKLKGEQSIGEDTLCYKIDYMSPNHANTINANYLSTLFEDTVPPQIADPRVQITIYGYRCLLFQRDEETGTPIFHGDGCLNNDKGNVDTFGLVNEGDSGNVTKCQKWEYLDNSEDICNFRSDKLYAPRGTSVAARSCVEACYPDQGDLDKAGLQPDYTHLQILYTWICQRANFWEADKDTTLETPLEYNGVSYNTEYDYKKAIFENEFEIHFNKNHALTYYLALETVALVDNRAKNMFLTCYDVTQDNLVFTDASVTSLMDIIDEDGTVDASKIDWENSRFAQWYHSLYDLDSCLGAENSGYNLVPYYAEWDYTLGDRKLFNGADSVLWKMIETAFASDIKALYVKLRDENKTLSYAKLYDAYITNNAALVCPTIVNQDARFKYIDIFTEGYDVYSEDNTSTSHVKTPNYLYLVQGSKVNQTQYFLYNRMIMLDSKYISASYEQDKITMRIRRGANVTGEDVALTLTPATSMYCRAEYGNDETTQELGYKANAGEQVHIVPADGDYSDIVLSIHGASNLSSLGDLSGLVANSIDISKGVKLRELILGSADANYSNDELTELTVTSCGLLQKIDIRNTGIQTELNLVNSPLIEEVYATGSKIPGITFPAGGNLKKLYLPETIINFKIENQNNIEEFEMAGTDALQMLFIANCNAVVMQGAAELLRDSYARLTSGIRLTGVDWDLSTGWTEDEIKTLINGLGSDAIKGKQLSPLGNLVDDANAYPVITGEVYIGEAINATELDNYENVVTNYPDLTIWSWTVEWQDRFGDVVETERVLNGATAHPPVIEESYMDGDREYRHNGWSLDYSSVTGNMVLTPIYSPVWEVKFQDKQGNLLKTEMVVDGQPANPPVGMVENYTDENYRYTHKGWNGDYTAIAADTTFTATYSIYWIVTWMGHGEQVLKTEEVINGQGATPPTEVPDYTVDGQVYTHADWDIAYSSIRQDTTINATYTTMWLVEWLNYDGTLVKSEYVLDGTSGNPPTKEECIKPSDAQYKYTLAGWNANYKTITANSQFTALFTSVPQSYRVEFYMDSTFETLLFTANGIMGSEVEYKGDELPIPDGYFFICWKDEYNNQFDTNKIYITEKNCFIDDDLNPVTIRIFAVIAPPTIELPKEQKSTFAEFSWPEIKAISNAIATGSTDDVTVEYDETEKAYTVTEVATGITSTVALFDTKDVEMQDGEVVTMMVSDFNHDEDEYGNVVGISLTTKNLYSNVTKNHYASSHAIMHYTVNGEPVADNTATYTYTNEGETDMEIVMESTGDTRLDSIKITNADASFTCWYFNKSTGTSTDTATYYSFAVANNIELGMSEYWNGLILNGVMGKIYKYSSTQYFTKMDEGASITVTLPAGAKIEIKGYSCYNLGGYRYSNLRTYLTQELIYNVPTLLQSFIVPVKKGSSLGGYSYEVEYMYDTLWALSYSEVGFGTSDPYGKEGKQYPVYTDNASRIKYQNNGSGSRASFWLRSTNCPDAEKMVFISDSGTYSSFYTNAYHAYYNHRVAFGFAL